MAIQGPIQRGYIGSGQDSRAIEAGQFAFSTTSTTFSLATGLRRVEKAFFTPIGTTATLSQSVNVNIGTLSATGTANIIVPATGTVTAVKFVVTTTVTAHNDNHWTFTLLNKTQTDAEVIATSSANSTDANSSPAGADLTAFTPRSFTLGAGVAVTAGDDLLFTATKAGSGADLVASSLIITINTASGDESIRLTGTPDAYGNLLPSSGAVTVARASQNPTSALVVSYLLIGV